MLTLLQYIELTCDIPVILKLVGTIKNFLYENILAYLFFSPIIFKIFDSILNLILNLLNRRINKWLT